MAEEHYSDEARALYDRLLTVMREAESLSYESDYHWESEGRELGHCTYRLWMKKPNCTRLEATVDGELRGVLVGDGEFFWIHWPKGRPDYGFDDAAEYERTRMTSYMKEPAPAGRHSISHQANSLAAGMCMLILQPSIFHGCRDGLEDYLDGVISMEAEQVAGEDCEVIELSYMSHQRSKYLWLSRTDGLPRKLREVVRVTHDIVTEEVWRDVRIGDEMPGEMFQWKPPEGWEEFHLPEIEEGLLKPGTEAPDFDLTATNGQRVKLSELRGRVVWLCFWRVGCPPCREEIPALERLHRQYGEKGLVVVGFDWADEREIAVRFLEESGASFLNIVDSCEQARDTCMEKYQTLKGCAAVPLNYVIDREGKIVAGWYGSEEEPGLAAIEKAGIT